MTESNSQVSPVAQRYAAALFELAVDAGAVDAVETDLNTVDTLLSESDDLRRLVRSPVFTADDQIKALTALAAKAGLGQLVSNFVLLVAKNRRLFALPDMIAGYRFRSSAYRGEISAEIISAEPLSDAQVKDLSDALRGATDKTVKLHQSVDASLIGGLVVRLGSRMIDTSLKTKLKSLKVALKEVG